MLLCVPLYKQNAFAWDLSETWPPWHIQISHWLYKLFRNYSKAQWKRLLLYLPYSPCHRSWAQWGGTVLSLDKISLTLRFFILSVTEQTQVKVFIFKCFELWEIYAKKVSLPVLSGRDNAKCYSQPMIGESYQERMPAQKGGHGVHKQIFSCVNTP